MKKDQTNEANIELNEQFNQGDIPTGQQNMTTAEANIELNKRFDSDHEPEEIPPTYLQNETAAVKISRKNK